MGKTMKWAYKVVPEDVTEKLSETVCNDGRRFTHVWLRFDGCAGFGSSECSPDDEWDRQEGYEQAWDRAFASFARDWSWRKRAKKTVFERVKGYLLGTA